MDPLIAAMVSGSLVWLLMLNIESKLVKAPTRLLSWTSGEIANPTAGESPSESTPTGAASSMVCETPGNVKFA